MSTETTDRIAANVAVIQDIYAAFGRGDIASILDHIAHDCRWEAWDGHTAQRAGVTYLQPQNGPGGRRRVLRRASPGFEIHDFGAGDLLASTTQVATAGHYGRDHAGRRALPRRGAAPVDASTMTGGSYACGITSIRPSTSRPRRGRTRACERPRRGDGEDVSARRFDSVTGPWTGRRTFISAGICV